MNAPATKEREAPISRAFGLIFPKPEAFAQLSPQDKRLARLLAEESGVPIPEMPTAAAIPIASLAKTADVHLGASEGGTHIGIDLARLVDGRLLVQGASGAGKSWTLRRLIEQTHGRIQQIIIDPEGEFKSVAEHFGMAHIEAHKLDTAAIALLASRARAHRLSLLLDLSELDREGQMQAVASFFQALIDAPRAHWHTCLVFVDEAHLFAPFGGQSSAATSVRRAAIGAVTDLMSRGRKRGLCGVLATQRLARMAKSVVSEMHNFLIGINTLDLDIRRAAETVGWDSAKAFDKLPYLNPGDFVAVGPAFSHSPVVFKVGTVETHHRGARPALTALDDIDAEKAAELLNLDELMDASAADEEVRDENALLPGLRAVRSFIRDAAFANAGRIWSELLAIEPNGASLSDIQSSLSLDAVAVTEAITLLDQYGVVDFMGLGEDRAVRVMKDMVPCR